MAEWRDFAATNEPGTCLWCGKRLRWPTTPFNPETGKVDTLVDPDTHTIRPGKPRAWRQYDKPGDYGDGYFCGLRCAYQFGVALADHGRRLAGVK